MQRFNKRKHNENEKSRFGERLWLSVCVRVGFVCVCVCIPKFAQRAVSITHVFQQLKWLTLNYSSNTKGNESGSQLRRTKGRSRHILLSVEVCMCVCQLFFPYSNQSTSSTLLHHLESYDRVRWRPLTNTAPLSLFSPFWGHSITSTHSHTRTHTRTRGTRASFHSLEHVSVVPLCYFISIISCLLSV